MLVGLLIVLLASRYQSRDEFFAAALIEIGAAVLLLGPLLLIERHLETSVREVKTEVAEARADLVDTNARLDALTPTEKLSEDVAARIAQSRQADLALFNSVADLEPTWQTVRDAVRTATQLGVVSRKAPRVALFDTRFMVRFVPTARIEHTTDLNDIRGESWLSLQLESQGGDVEERFKWSGERSAADVGEEIGQWLIAKGEWAGDIAYQPGKMFDDLRTMLVVAHAQVTGAGGLTKGLAPVIQLCGSQWWITDRGVQSAETTYDLPVDRLDEPDWDSHVTAKGWVDVGDFRQALDTARAFVKRGLL